jgi:phosphoserine phosphatase
VQLDATGRAQCRALAELLADIPFDLAVHTGFPRTIESLDMLIAGRNLPRVAMPEFGDVHLGVFEGRPVGEYRRWRRGRSPGDRPPGGESRLDALTRYLAGVEHLLALDADRVLAVVHDVPIRFIANAAQGDDPVDGPVTFIPNASPRAFAARALGDAARVMRARLAAPA